MITSLLRHYYVIITISLLPIITSLLHHYYVIITSFLRHYYKLRHYYNFIITYYYIIITSLLHNYNVIITSLLQTAKWCNDESFITYYYIVCFHYNAIITIITIITYYYVFETGQLANAHWQARALAGSHCHCGSGLSASYGGRGSAGPEILSPASH